MKFGVCTDLQNMQLAQDVGFDYVEAKLNSLAAMEQNEFDRLYSSICDLPIQAERCCLLLPKSMQVIGSSYDELEMVRYLQGAFSRMNQLGASIAVFGSGKSRDIPNGMNYQSAFSQLVQVTQVIGNVASDYGISIAIEPLNRKETHLINSLAEGAALQAMVDMPNVGLLVDSFHLNSEGESLERISETAPLMHAHIATVVGRRFPLEADDETQSFLTALCKTGYDGSVSIEGKTDDFEHDSRIALQVMRSICKEQNNG